MDTNNFGFLFATLIQVGLLLVMLWVVVNYKELENDQSYRCADYWKKKYEAEHAENVRLRDALGKEREAEGRFRQA
ncbi:MAG: hypothetical protein KGL39_47120 [Patescibacteria group bacterium]|nr:hypothetical protein [Patescibacteria group bacterium]